MPASYFLGNRLLGQGPNPWWSDTQPETHSQVLVCPTCGEAWGRVFIPGKPWTPVTRGCKLHPYLSDAGGSFIPPWRSTFAELPPEVLVYEATIRLEKFSCQEIESSVG